MVHFGVPFAQQIGHVRLQSIFRSKKKISKKISFNKKWIKLIFQLRAKTRRLMDRS